MSGDVILKDAILSGVPCVLLLGQAVDGDRESASSVLNRLLERKGLQASVGWPDVLATGLTSEDLEWLTERFERTVPTEAFQSALELPWDAVFTSSIDPSLLRRLETLGRQPEALSSSQHHPRAPRSTARPPVHYLFGRSNDVTDATRPPRTRNDLARRLAQHASALLSRVAETVTPAGLLVVDSYRPGMDWLPLDALFGALPSDGSVRVLWLGAGGADKSSLFADLLRNGSAWSDPRPLAAVASELRASGALPVQAIPVFHEPGVVSLPGSAFLEIKPALRLRVEASAAVVEDDWTATPTPVGRDAEEELFRLTHGNPGNARSLVEGVSRGFFITRPFEAGLWGRVSGSISQQGSDERVLVLHGQSGTGKSIALARLAHQMRTQHRSPVLFASERVPEAADVEAFCEEVDRSGYGPTLILADSNALPERYFALSGALRSRGRRHLIVGTSYRQAEHAAGTYLIEAPDAVSAAEREDVVALLTRFLPADRISPEVLNGEHVLALLYRAFSAGRARIASGLGNEARFVESAIRQRTQKAPRPRFTSTLAEKLIAAGLRGDDETLFEPADADAPDRDAAGRLIDYVMVAGRVDVAVPVNLLLRALRARVNDLDHHQIAAMFGGLDLFRWRHGGADRSELLVGARLRLEAELICRRRVGGSDRELECLIDLIGAVRTGGLDHDSELQFLLDLLQRLDRGGPRETAYAAGYLRIGRALTDLRKEHGVDDASLMLQESNFRRQWLWFHHVDSVVTPEVRDQVLDEARGAVEEALRRVEARSLKAGRRTRDNLYVERASIYGYLAVGHAKAGTELIWPDYLAARVAVRRAMGVAPSYFPFDVALWTPADLLEESGDSLSSAQRSELVADIYSTLDRVDSRELPPNQLEQFNRRRAKLATLLKDEGLEATALSDLEAHAPSVAAFLKARAMALHIFSAEVMTFTDEQRRRARQAADYLVSRQAVISTDVRCLRLLLDLAWIAETGQRLLRDERRAIPFRTEAREDILSIVSDLVAASGDAVEAPIRYLEAVLQWVLGDFKAAAATLRELSRETDFDDRRRVVRKLIMTDASGQPMLFRGRLAAARTPGHWSVELDGSAARVDLLERDFRGQLFRLGGEIRDFRIVFNYLGPIADPPTRQEDR